MASDDELNFHEVLSFIHESCRDKINYLNNKSSMQEVNDDVSQSKQDMLFQTKKYIDQFMDKLKDLNPDESQMIIRGFIRDLIIHETNRMTVEMSDEERGFPEESFMYGLEVKIYQLIAQTEKQRLVIQKQHLVIQDLKKHLKESNDLNIKIMEKESKMRKKIIPKLTEAHKSIEEQNFYMAQLVKIIETQDKQIEQLKSQLN